MSPARLDVAPAVDEVRNVHWGCSLFIVGGAGLVGFKAHPFEGEIYREL